MNGQKGLSKGWALRTISLILCMMVVMMTALPAYALDYVHAKGHVYLRKAANTDSDVLVVLAPDAKLKVLGASGDWYQVQYGKKTGYVRNDVVYVAGTTPSASGTVEYETLKRGMSGDQVFRLQEALANIGFFDAMPDRSFGESTEIAVKNFQANNGLKNDGIAGDKTLRLLWGEPTATVTGSPTTDTAANGFTTLRTGATGTAVTQLQQRLIDLGYLTGKADGTYLSSTVEAVKLFQQKHGITVDGIAGVKTQEKLFSTSAVAITPSTTETADNGVLKLGSKGEAVRNLQNRLIQLGYLAGKADGTYGAATETAVMLFQEKNSLGQDGVAGTKTQNAIFASTAKANASTADTLLKQGVSGDPVKQLQTQLKNLGYYTGSITGTFGELTHAAVVAFQKANGLSADGVAGTTTLSKLYSGSAIAKNKEAGATAQPPTSAGSVPSAASVIFANWYTVIRPKYKNGTVVTIYDFETKLSWKCKFMSVGKHADSDPLTSADTEIMYNAFGKKNTWTPKAVWVTMPDGKTYMASMHNMPHLSGGIKDNNFDGHLCIHFPRDMAEAEQTGPYAVSHQKAILAGWEKTQRLAGN